MSMGRLSVLILIILLALYVAVRAHIEDRKKLQR